MLTVKKNLESENWKESRNRWRKKDLLECDGPKVFDYVAIVKVPLYGTNVCLFA